MRSKIVCLTLTLVITWSSVLADQNKPSQDAQPPEIAEVIRRFTEAETQNKIARNNYTFTQDFDLITLGPGGSVTGRFKRVSDIVFDDRSNRFEKITFFPPPTTQVMTAEDMQDMGGVQPFALTTEDLPKYQIDYIGKEKIDELNTHVFDVKPKTIVKGERYLEGRIWVDDQDLQIVKTAGRAVPQFENNKFPRYETYRENIAGRFWFPTYTYVDDVLEFKNSSLHLRIVLRYTNYKKFSARIRVADEGEAANEEEVKAAEKNKPGAPATKPPDQPNKPELKRPKKP